MTPVSMIGYNATRRIPDVKKFFPFSLFLARSGRGCRADDPGEQRSRGDRVLMRQRSLGDDYVDGVRALPIVIGEDDSDDAENS